MNSAGYPNNLGAENIYAGQSNGVSAVAGWVNSAGHRNNILHANLQELGVGWALGGSYGTMTTQNFGTQNGSYTPLSPTDNSQDNSQGDSQNDNQDDSQYEELEIPYTDDPLSYVETGKTNVLVFGRAICLNTMHSLPLIDKLITDGSRQGEIELLFFDVDQDEETIKNVYAQKKFQNVKAYRGGNNAMWGILRDFGVGNSILFPVIVYINPRGDIVNVTTGLSQLPEITENISRAN
jgi:hypothetical protein